MEKVDKVIVIITSNKGTFHQVLMTEDQMEMVKAIIKQKDGSVKALETELSLEFLTPQQSLTNKTE